MRWLNDGQESRYTKVNKLNSVVATRSDLIEDYSHIRSLGEALSGSKVHTYGLANCNFNPATLTTFVESVRWAEAALNEVNVAFNQIGSEGGIALRDALKSSSLKFLAIGKMYTSAGGTVITGSQLATGVTLSAGGRLGELAEGPDSYLNVKLKWTDTSETSSWMTVSYTHLTLPTKA